GALLSSSEAKTTGALERKRGPEEEGDNATTSREGKPGFAARRTGEVFDRESSFSGNGRFELSTRDTSASIPSVSSVALSSSASSRDRALSMTTLQVFVF